MKRVRFCFGGDFGDDYSDVLQESCTDILEGKNLEWKLLFQGSKTLLYILERDVSRLNFFFFSENSEYKPKCQQH